MSGVASSNKGNRSQPIITLGSARHYNRPNLSYSLSIVRADSPSRCNNDYKINQRRSCCYYLLCCCCWQGCFGCADVQSRQPPIIGQQYTANTPVDK